MTQHQSVLKSARLSEQSNGRFRLFLADEPTVPVSDIEFNNRKAARNWARGRGLLVCDVGLDGASLNGAN